MKDRIKKFLDLRYMHLMDHLDVFMDCPWGAVAYEFSGDAPYEAEDVCDSTVWFKVGG